MFGVFWKIILTPSTSNLLDVLLDDPVRRDSHGAGRQTLPEALTDVAVRAGRKQKAILVEQPPVHGVAGVDVFGNCLPA